MNFFKHCLGINPKKVIQNHKHKKVSPEKNYFFTLPAELLFHVFTYLTPRELAFVGRVCSRFYQATQDEKLPLLSIQRPFLREIEKKNQLEKQKTLNLKFFNKFYTQDLDKNGCTLGYTYIALTKTTLAYLRDLLQQGADPNASPYLYDMLEYYIQNPNAMVMQFINDLLEKGAQCHKKEKFSIKPPCVNGWRVLESPYDLALSNQSNHPALFALVEYWSHQEEKRALEIANSAIVTARPH